MYWKNVVERVLPGVKIQAEDWEAGTVSLYAKDMTVLVTQECLRAFGENATMTVEGGRLIYKDRQDNRGDLDYPFINILVEHADFPQRPKS